LRKESASFGEHDTYIPNAEDAKGAVSCYEAENELSFQYGGEKTIEAYYYLASPIFSSAIPRIFLSSNYITRVTCIVNTLFEEETDVPSPSNYQRTMDVTTG
jgi:hypothetical protein